MNSRIVWQRSIAAPVPMSPSSPSPGERPFLRGTTESSIATTSFSIETRKSSAVRRCLCSLHTLLIAVLLLCVVSSTAVVWSINITTAVSNAEDLAEKQTRIQVRQHAVSIAGSLSHSRYFTDSDGTWMISQEGYLGGRMDWEFFHQNVLPRIIFRHLESPFCSVSSVGTSDDLMVTVAVEFRGTSQETWYLYTANTSAAPMRTQVIQPSYDGSYTVISEGPPSNVAYTTHQYSWFRDAPSGSAKFIPIYFSGQTAVPYIFVGLRLPVCTGQTIVFMNGMRTNGFSEQFRVNLSAGSVLYAMERSAGASLLAASRGEVYALQGPQSVAMPALQSPEPIIRESAGVLVYPGPWWMSVPAYSKHHLSDGELYFILTEPLLENGLNYLLVQVTPEDTILSAVNQATKVTIIICSLLIGGDIVVAVVLGIVLARPLNRMHRRMTNLAT
eukprot:RCo002345